MDNNDELNNWFKQNIENIENYISSFLGYGDIYRKIWLIGVEEGVAGQNQSDAVIEFRKKVNFWINKDKPSTLFLSEIPDHELFFLNNKNQGVWSHLLAFLNTYLGNEFNPLKKDYRILAENVNLFELFPLPCKKIKIAKKNWPYQKFKNHLSYLESKDLFWKYSETVRGLLFEIFLNLEQPKLILFYTSNHEKYWCLKSLNIKYDSLKKEIFGRSILEWILIDQTFIGFASHPLDVDSQDYEYWIQLGSFIRSKLESKKVLKV